MNKVITIGREFGSGGREIGRKLANELGFAYYDKEIITQIAKNTSLSEQYVQQIMEKTPQNFFPITVAHSFTYVDSYMMSQKQSIYSEQEKVIREMAEKSDCVIVGRCADYILRDYNPFRIFVYASQESKLARCMEHRMEGEEQYNERQMLKHIRSVDKNRARYYEFYTGLEWGNKLNYDICINTTGINIDEIIPHLAKMI